MPGRVDLGFFQTAFWDAVLDDCVVQIHFNLEGILELGFSNYNEFTDQIDRFANGDCIFDEFNVTAWELCSIRNDPYLLGITTFYGNGSTSLGAFPFT